MRRALPGLVLALLFVLAVPAASQDIKGQKPVLIIDGAFQFTPRAWGTYIIHDKDKDEYYVFTMSVLEDEARKGRTGSWLEIDIDTFKERVVTRVLVEKGKSGPGEVMAGIVWVEGLKPFSVPEKYLAGEDQEVGQFQTAPVGSKVEQRSFTHDGQKLDGFLAESRDAKGGVTRALVSTGVAPMGLVWADAPGLEMFLDDWGGGAETRIKEKPIGMFAWIMDMVARGISGEDVAIPERKIPQPRLDGVWEEVDDGCSGSRWTFGADGRSAAADWRCAGATGTGALQALAWKTPRIMAGRLDGGNRAGQAQLMFTSDTRGVLVVKGPDGAPSTFTVLQKAR